MTGIKSKLPQPDSKTILQCRNGNTEAFRAIVDMYQDYVRNLIFKIIPNDDQINDLSQDVFIKLWQNMARYNEKYLFSTWLYRIAMNTCFDQLKAQKTIIKSNLEDISGDEISITDDKFLNKDLIKTIRQISRILPLKQRLVFILKDLQDLSTKEVSEILNMSTGSIKSNLYYARKLIKEQFLKMEKLEGKV